MIPSAAAPVDQQAQAMGLTTTPGPLTTGGSAPAIDPSSPTAGLIQALIGTGNVVPALNFMGENITAQQAARTKAAEQARQFKFGLASEEHKAGLSEQAASKAFDRELGKLGLQSKLKDSEKTTIMKNLEASGLQPGTPDYRDAMLKAVTKPKVSIDQRGAGEFAKEFAKQNAKSFFEEKDAAQDAADSIRSSIEARALLDKGVITGFGADFATGFGNALAQAGFKAAEDPVVNTQAFAATRAQEVGRIIKLFGAGTGLSDADREYAQKAAAGNIEMTETAIRRVLDINERAARNVLGRYNKKAEAIDPSLSPFPQTVEVPEAPAAEPKDIEGLRKKYGIEPTR